MRKMLCAKATCGRVGKLGQRPVLHELCDCTEYGHLIATGVKRRRFHCDFCGRKWWEDRLELLKGGESYVT